MVWKGQPERRRYVLNIWFNIAIKIFIVVFLLFWLCLVTRIMLEKLSSGVITDYTAFFVPYIIGCVLAVVGMIVGVIHVYKLISKRISEASMVQYEVSDERITVKSDKQNSVGLSKVKEVIVVYSWIYGSKEYGDIYFRQSEKEFLTSGLNSILTKPQTPKALGFIAVKEPEEAAQVICNALQDLTNKHFEYKVI